MSKNVLLVIDIQKQFAESFSDKTIKNISAEIQKAISKKDYIIFVEYDGYEKTDIRLRRLVKGYKNFCTVRKSDDDGSREIMKVVNSKRLSKRTMRVCGVNTDACVQETVVGLSCLIPSQRKDAIKVVGKACDTAYGGHKSALRLMGKNKNVRILK